MKAEANIFVALILLTIPSAGLAGDLFNVVSGLRMAA
jgi:hypothetical protein